MKKINALIILAVGLALTPSCKKKLDLNPTASLAPETVGPADIQRLVNGIYDAMQNGNTTFYYLSFVTEDLSADNLRYRATFFQHGEVDANSILSNNVLNQRYFVGPYNYIQRANDVIEIAEGSSLPEATKRTALGTAYFARAYGYYNLVTLYGGVPILLTRSIAQVPRNTEAQVYDRIIQDLLKAIEMNPPFTTNSYVSVDAAKALLARVYLIRKDYVNAKKYADEVIAAGRFSVTNNYETFLNSPGSSPEVIMMLRFTATEAENALYFFLQHPNQPGSGRAELPVDNSLVAAFEPNDIRRPAIIEEIVAPAANPGFYAKKYRDPGGTFATPRFVVRTAEMYLISAEAQYFISNMNNTDAVMLGRLNEVRTKRGLTAVTTANLQTIIRERRVELAFENLRWTDMKRTPDPTNPAKSMALVYVESKGRRAEDLLYPIPQQEIDVNPALTQNPGY